MEHDAALKMEGNFDTRYNMNEPQRLRLTKMSQLKKDKYCRMPVIRGT